MLIGVLVVLIGVTHPHARTPQVTAMTFVGWVHVQSTADLGTTVVTVMSGATQASSTDLVSVAFRLQHTAQPVTHYAGPATVVYSRTRLTIAVTDRVGWTFVVPVPDSVPGSEALGYPHVDLRGLAFFWGASVHDREAVVFEQLTVGPCLAGSRDECADCLDVGDGTGCNGSCPDGDCQVVCGGGTRACCKCPASCTCCADIQG
jgi:hypothetical protein